MISLTNFINIYENEDVYLHLFAEYHKRGFDRILINEFHSIPTDFNRIWKYCVTTIIKKSSGHRIVNDKYSVNVDLDYIGNKNPLINNVNFEIITLPKGKTVDGKYDYDGNDNKITIKIPIGSSKYDIGSVVLHELVHLYRDKQYKKIGTSLLSKLYSDSYDRYSNFISTEDDVNNLKQILYKTNKEELPAFVSEIKPYIEKHSPQSPQEALSVLVKNDEYIFYKGLINIVENNKLKDIYPDILNIYNDVYKTFETDEDKIIRILNRRLTHAYNFFIKRVSKFCCDCVKLQIDGNNSREMTKTLNKKLYSNVK